MRCALLTDFNNEALVQSRRLRHWHLDKGSRQWHLTAERPFIPLPCTSQARSSLSGAALLNLILGINCFCRTFKARALQHSFVNRQKATPYNLKNVDCESTQRPSQAPAVNISGTTCKGPSISQHRVFHLHSADNVNLMALWQEVTWRGKCRGLRAF